MYGIEKLGLAIKVAGVIGVLMFFHPATRTVGALVCCACWFVFAGAILYNQRHWVTAALLAPVTIAILVVLVRIVLA